MFDDDFYSTKVSSRNGKHYYRTTRRKSQFWPRSRKLPASPTWRITVISSLFSAIVAVLLFSFISGMSSSHSGAEVRNLHQAQPVGGDPFERIVQVAAKVRPAVVSIVNHKDKKDKNMDDAVLGSGVIFKKENGKAFVITNDHVIDGAQELEVVTVDGKSIVANVVGKDQVTDLAVLEMDGDDIKAVADMGDSDDLRVGETVVAIGNPLGLGDTLTSGIVSYTNRVVPVSLNQDGVYDWEQEVIQTDAAINEGNSGGALVDLNGHVIGINTMKIADSGVEGIGFAIPSNRVMKTVDDLVAHGKVSRPYLGVYSVDLNNPYSPLDKDELKNLKLPAHVTDGVIVLEVVGPAEKAGLKLNDVITEFDKQPIKSTLELRKYLYDHKKIGDSLEVTFYRDGELKTTTVTLEEKPEDPEK
nr:trypsin-like peptidase domain-containing protein [Paenibacillus sediminis]